MEAILCKRRLEAIIVKWDTARKEVIKEFSSQLTAFLLHAEVSTPSFSEEPFLVFLQKNRCRTKRPLYRCWYDLRVSSPSTAFHSSLCFEDDILDQNTSHVTSQLCSLQALEVFPTSFSKAGVGCRLFCASGARPSLGPAARAVIFCHYFLPKKKRKSSFLKLLKTFSQQSWSHWTSAVGGRGGERGLQEGQSRGEEEALHGLLHPRAVLGEQRALPAIFRRTVWGRKCKQMIYNIKRNVTEIQHQFNRSLFSHSAFWGCFWVRSLLVTKEKKKKRNGLKYVSMSKSLSLWQSRCLPFPVFIYLIRTQNQNADDQKRTFFFFPFGVGQKATAVWEKKKQAMKKA